MGEEVTEVSRTRANFPTNGLSQGLLLLVKKKKQIKSHLGKEVLEGGFYSFSPSKHKCMGIKHLQEH